MNYGTRIVIEAGPVALFFIVNKLAGIYWGTGVLMASTLVATLASWRLERKLPVMPLLTAVLVIVFGGLTLILADDIFIKIKPTISSLLFGLVLLGGLATGRALIKPVLGHTIRMPDAAWRTLTLRWALFFLFLAVVNEIVWRNFSTDFWVGFKLFGLMPMSILFMGSQIPFILRHHPELGQKPPNNQ